jgi:hypothetical protein
MYSLTISFLVEGRLEGSQVGSGAEDAVVFTLARAAKIV